MTTDSPALASAVIAQLLAQGLTDIVVSPGSRSGPLAVAADLSSATVHVRTDERSAAFLALGIAKVQRRPCAVVTTSGTAVGNLLPAVMEAHHAGVPLIVITADRPSSLVGTQANQTTLQVGIFSAFVRTELRVSSTGDPRSWASAVGRVALAANGTTSRDPGPAHLNVELDDPLVGPIPQTSATNVRAAQRPRLPSIELDPGPRTVIIAGDAPRDVGAEAAALAIVADVPLIAEPSSNARGPESLNCGRLLLGTELASDVERVIVYGHPTLSRPVTSLLSRRDVDLIAVTDTPSWPDPGWQVRQVCGGVLLDASSGGWGERWRHADRRLSDLVADQYATDETGGRLAAGVVNALTDRDTLFVGPSQIVRELDLAPWPTLPPLVLANRGLAGIDGVVSTAMGAALGLGTPVTALVGDLTFLHDTNGLMRSAGPAADLRIIVADDNGGAIFSTLESGTVEEAVFDRVYRTSHGLDLQAVATGFGASSRRLNVDEALAAMREPVSGIEVIVVPVESSGLPQRVRALSASAASVVAAGT